MQFARGLPEAVAFAHGDGDVGLFNQRLPFFPGVQLHQAVAAEQPPESGGGKLLAENLHRVEGVGRAAAHDVAVADGKTRVFCRCQFDHGKAIGGGSGGGVFVIRAACRQENNRVQPDFIGKGTGDMKMSVVYRVESTAEQSDFLHDVSIPSDKSMPSETLPSTIRVSLPVTGWITNP